MKNATFSQAKAIACSTDCLQYRQGTCPFTMDEKKKCPRIREIMMFPIYG